MSPEELEAALHELEEAVAALRAARGDRARAAPALQAAAARLDAARQRVRALLGPPG